MTTEFGHFLRRKMAAHNPPLSQAELARRAGVGQASVSRWIKGPGPPSVDSLRKLSDVLNVDYPTLLTVAGYGEPDPDVSTALAGLRPQVDDLAAELSLMIDAGSPLSDDERTFLRHMVDRLVDPYRGAMRAGRKAPRR